MTEMKFTDQHEWISIDGDTATVGISEFAANQLGDVVFVELPQVGAELKQFDEAATVESVKAASEVYSPITGEVIAVNDELADNPALINEEPTGKGWFMKIKITDKDGLAKLMDTDAYKEFVKGLE